MSFELQNVSLRLANKTVCRNLSLSLKPGEIWGILGKNGIGKTTFLHGLCGIKPFQEGSILFKKQPLLQSTGKEKAKLIGLLQQEQQYVFPNTVFEMVMAGRHPHCSKLFNESKVDHKIVQEILTKFELRELAHKNVLNLSGGEKQRVAIATLFAQQPHILLLDEPCNHLDIQHQIRILEQLQHLAKKENKIIIMVLHDLNLIAKFCDKVLLLFGDSTVRFGNTHTEFTEQQLKKLYGHPIKIIEIDGLRHFVL